MENVKLEREFRSKDLEGAAGCGRCGCDDILPESKCEEGSGGGSSSTHAGKKVCGSSNARGDVSVERREAL